MPTTTVQEATEKLLLGQSARAITAMGLPKDEYHRRIRVSAPTTSPAIMLTTIHPS